MAGVRIFNISIQIWGSITALLIIIGMCAMKHTKRRAEKYYLWMLAFHIGNMMMDTIAFYFRGKEGFWNEIGVRAFNFLSFLCGGVMAVLFIAFQHAYLERKFYRKLDNKAVRLGWILFGVQSVLLLINLRYPFIYEIDEHNLYRRLPAYPINYVFSFFLLILALIITWYYHKKLEPWELFSFTVYSLLPFVTVLVTVWSYELAVGHLGNTIALVVVYIFLQAEYGRREVEREQELTQMRVAIMMNQIQPHFLFNVLNTIEYLCNIGSKDAGEAVNHFASYLRKNMESVSRQDPVPLEEELKHLENYLYIEHIRFPEIAVSYDLKCKDFQVPPLSIQPMVENAIKHGFADQKEDERIRIETGEETDRYSIRITDNGCGFDVNLLQNKDGQHVGIENTRNRLQTMCGGSLDIQSEPGKGTCVRIWIPK